MVDPEDPGLCRLLAADDALHYQLEKQRLGALPVLQPRLDPDIFDIHRYGSAGQHVQYSVPQCIL